METNSATPPSLTNIPIEVIEYIITLALEDDISVIRSLTINKRIWTLTDRLWPIIMHSQLVFSSYIDGFNMDAFLHRHKHRDSDFHINTYNIVYLITDEARTTGDHPSYGLL